MVHQVQMEQAVLQVPTEHRERMVHQGLVALKEQMVLAVQTERQVLQVAQLRVELMEHQEQWY